MTVVEIERGKLVQVLPDALNAKDIIEFAEALIEEEGWVQGTGGAAGQGWSIHGAIGEASDRVTPAPGGNRQGKDNPTARPLRNEAAALLTETDPQHRNEMEINDQAQDVDEALVAMRRARGVAV